MRHKHKKIANGPISDDALCKVAKNYCAHLARRMRKNRIDDTLCITPEYVYRMWGGCVAIEEIRSTLVDVRRMV